MRYAAWSMGGIVNTAKRQALLIELLEDECHGHGDSAIAELVRNHEWTFRVTLSDKGITVEGSPPP